MAKCGLKYCKEEVFIACPVCQMLLCYDHRNTECDNHVLVQITMNSFFTTLRSSATKDPLVPLRSSATKDPLRSSATKDPLVKRDPLTMKRSIDSFFSITATDVSNKKQRGDSCPSLVDSVSMQPYNLENTDTAKDEAPGLSTKSKARSFHKQNRYYNKQWEQKYSWLSYSEEHGGAFCKLCQNFQKNDVNVLQKTGGVFITVPFTSFRKALGKDGKIEKHEHSSTHTSSVVMENMRRQAIKKPVQTQLVQQSERERDCNKLCLKILLRGLYFLVKEEVSHTTKYSSLIEGILDKLNNDFKAWREAQSDRSNYSSKDTACELLECMGEVVREHLKKSLENKKFSILADESTSVRNEMQLSIMFRVMEGRVPVEKFLAVVKIPNGKAETIADTIDKELASLGLCYDNLIAFGFDGASNMAGNVAGVRKKLSEKANREVVYIHCRAHVLSLAAASCRNRNQKVKRFFHVLKDIYKLFSKSPKKENILHEIQAVLHDPVLKIPECIEVRWLSHHRIVNAVLRSYKSILLACEHIHKEGVDLASLAGGILLEMRNESFFVICHVMNELLCALSYLSSSLQKENISLSKVIPLTCSTKLHLKNIAQECDDSTSGLRKNVRSAIAEKFGSDMCLIADEEAGKTFKGMKQYCESVIDEIDERFNDKAMSFMNFASRFEIYQSFMDLEDNEVRMFCDNFSMLDVEGVLADIKSFKFFLKLQHDSEKCQADERPLTTALKADIGYCELQKLCEILLTIPVTTASVERSFSTMNRILTKARNRMTPETLMHCMMISIEGPNIPTEDFLDEVVHLYAIKKFRRIRLL